VTEFIRGTGLMLFGLGPSMCILESSNYLDPGFPLNFQIQELNSFEERLPINFSLSTTEKK
jgi:hypothetical protein